MNITHHRIRLSAAIVLSALALALAFGAPALVGDAGETGAPQNIRTETTEPTSPVHDGGPLADGTYFGRITAAYVAPGEVVFDRRELLLGDEARAAAAAEGREAFDYYIRDTGLPRLVLPASDATTVTTVECGDDGCAQGRAQTYGDFTRSFDDRAAERHFEIVVSDGVIVSIDEQYFA